MGVQDTNEVDIIAINKDTDICTLTIIDSLEWENEEEHLFLLQEKINIYLSFIESGEIYSTYPASKGQKFEINIRFRVSIPERCEQFLQQVSNIISDAGFILTHSMD
jgi:hypothetical protein